jgi:hypothetical protein
LVPEEESVMATFQYRCSGGHEVEARYPLERCPACVRGERCPGELTRVGEGSRGPRKVKG